jgi:hypothetical protein
VVSVDARMVLRLTDSIDGLHKGCVVLAMFPDTTSFYRYPYKLAYFFQFCIAPCSIAMLRAT